MLNTLYVYTGLLKPSVLESLVKLEGLFETLNYTDHEIETSEIEMLEGMSDEDKAHRVTNAYEKHIDVLLLLLGVFLVPDDDRITLPFKVSLLEGVFSLEDTDNLDIVTSTLLEMDDADALMVFVELLVQVTAFQPAFLLARIEDVETKLIQRLKKKTALPDLQASVEHVRHDIRDRILAVDGAKEGIIYRTIARTSQLPLSWSVASAAILRHAEDTAPDVLGREVYLATLAADIDPIAQRQEAITLLDDVYGDNPSYSFALDSLLSYLKESTHVKE